MLKGEAGHQKKEFEHLSAWLDKQPPFDVALIPYALLLGLAPCSRPAASRSRASCRGRTSSSTASWSPGDPRPKELIAQRAKDVELFIAGSRYYADMMSADLKIPRDKIEVVHHGIDIDERLMTLKSAHSPEFTVGFFARIAPEKGLHVLADAYIKFRERRPERKARLAAGGYLAGEHRSYLLGIEDKLRAAGREPEFHYYGSPDRQGKFEFLRSLDLLAAPTPYREPKGLFAMEAMACGVPVVLPRHGAFPEIIETTDGRLAPHRGRRGGTGCGARAAGRRPRDTTGHGHKRCACRARTLRRPHDGRPDRDLLAGLHG
jgi:glycosyltransferase involved in cell wall biosynthesis